MANPRAWANPWIAAFILALLFSVQRFGTDNISKAFAPIMLGWFLAIAGLGLPPILSHPAILFSLSPLVGFGFLFSHPGEAMTMLASVTLAITGAEALYADLGHFGRPAISLAWNLIVAPCLIINYIGQGAHALGTPSDVSNIFFSLAPGRFRFLLTLLSIAATVIASQALISGAFSLTRQAVNLGYFPRTTVKHTCAEHEGQIYLPGICFLLAIGSISLVLLFKRSDNLADAYGLAVTGTMVTTTIAYAAISLAIHKRIPWIAGLLLMLDLSLFIPNSTKFLTGGYIPVGVGVIVAFILISWERYAPGHSRRACRKRHVPGGICRCDQGGAPRAQYRNRAFRQPQDRAAEPAALAQNRAGAASAGDRPDLDCDLAATRERRKPASGLKNMTTAFSEWKPILGSWRKSMWPSWNPRCARS